MLDLIKNKDFAKADEQLRERIAQEIVNKTEAMRGNELKDLNEKISIDQDALNEATEIEVRSATQTVVRLTDRALKAQKEFITATNALIRDIEKSEFLKDAYTKSGVKPATLTKSHTEISKKLEELTKMLGIVLVKNSNF